VIAVATLRMRRVHAVRTLQSWALNILVTTLDFMMVSLVKSANITVSFRLASKRGRYLEEKDEMRMPISDGML